MIDCDGLRWVEVECWDAWTLEGPDGLVFGEVELDRDGWSWWRRGGEHDFGLESTRLVAKLFAEGGGPAVEPNDCDDLPPDGTWCKPSNPEYACGVLVGCDGTKATTDNDEGAS